MTSSDILDTTFSIQLTRAADILFDDLDKLLSALKARAIEHKYTPTIGRSHGIHAEPTTFGLKLARFYAEFERNKNRLKAAKEEISTCAISGAIGTFAHIDPKVEQYVAKKMNLQMRKSQVKSYLEIATLCFSVLGVIASSIENLAIEIRHLQRTEVREAEEFFSIGQKRFFSYAS